MKENCIKSYGRIIQQVKFAELLNRILGRSKVVVVRGFTPLEISIR